MKHNELHALKVIGVEALTACLIVRLDVEASPFGKRRSLTRGHLVED